MYSSLIVETQVLELIPMNNCVILLLDEVDAWIAYLGLDRFQLWFKLNVKNPIENYFPGYDELLLGIPFRENSSMILDSYVENLLSIF